MPRLALYLFWFILIFAPLAAGTSVVWAKTLVEALCFALLLWCIFELRRNQSELYALPGRLPLLLIVALPLVQLIPLPQVVLRFVSSTSWEVYSESIWVVRPEAWMPISLDPKATMGEFFRLASFAAFYLATVQLLDRRERLKQTLSVLTGFAALFAMSGAVFYLASGGRIFWLLGEWQGAAVGNRDHFAGLVAMLLPVILGFFLAIRPQVGYLSLQEAATDFLRHPRSHPHLLVGASMLLLVGVLFLSGSSVGLVSSLGSLLVFIVLLLIRGSRRKKRLWGALAVIVLLFTAVFFSWGMIWSDQFREEESGHLARQTETVWLDTLHIVGDFPVLGAGMGAYETVYPRYRTVRDVPAEITHAGNDYLEQLAEGGGVGVLLLAWFLFAVLRHSWPEWRQRHNRMAVYLYLGSLAGLAAVLIHSWSDFVRGIGAFGLYSFFLAGLAVSASHTRSRNEGFPELEAQRDDFGGPGPVSVTALLIFSLLYNGGVLVGQYRAAEIAAAESHPDIPEAERRMMTGLAVQAARFDPLEGEYRYLQGDFSLAEGDVEKALEHFGAALRRNPMEAEYLQRIAMVYDNRGEKEKAGRLLRAGVANDQSSAERHKNLAFWLLNEGKRREGLQHVRQAIEWDSGRTQDFIALMLIYGVGDEEMRRVLPQRPVPLLAYGDYLASVGKQEAAEQSYREAIEVAVREEQPSPIPFQRISEYYTEKEDYDEALEIVQAGIERFPEKAEFRVLAGLLYEELAISYRAIEEYRRALILDPDNREARSQLEKLTGSYY